MTEKRPREIPTQPSETGAAEHDEGAEADECIEEAWKQDEAAEPSQSFDTRSPSTADVEAVLKKAKTSGAAEHGAAVATHARGIVHQLPETPDDVLPDTLSRLGPNMYQGTLRSGTIWLGDAELLR